MQPSEVRVLFPARSIVSLIVAGVGLVIAINLIDAIQGVLIWSLAAIFLALAAEAPIRMGERHGMAREAATVGVYFGALTIVLGILAAVLVPLASQTTSLIDDLPRIVDRLRESSAIRDLDQRFHVLNGLDNVQARAPDAAGILFGLTGTVFGLVLGAVSVFFLALFTSFELPRITRGVLSLLPPDRAELVDTRIDDVNRVVARYVGANLAISAIAMVVHLIALELLGVPFAFVLAILVGLFDLVPLVGATIAGLIVVGVGFTQGVEVGIACLVLVVVLPAAREPRPPAGGSWARTFDGLGQRRRDLQHLGRLRAAGACSGGAAGHPRRGIAAADLLGDVLWRLSLMPWRTPAARRRRNRSNRCPS